MKSDSGGSDDWWAKRHANHKTQVDPALTPRNRLWINVSRKHWYLERADHNCPIESNAKATEKKQNKRLLQGLFSVADIRLPLPILMLLGNFLLQLQSSQFPAEPLVSSSLTRKSSRNC